MKRACYRCFKKYVKLIIHTQLKLNVFEILSNDSESLTYQCPVKHLHIEKY